MTQNQQKKVAHVCLVGAGPGDPGLITVAGMAALRQAEVVVYDALANPTLLAEAPPAAQLIDVGKRAAQHTLTQEQTNDLLVELAKAGKRVVRLKGGDPYLFGRGAEEAAYLAEHGVTCRIIPGITSGIAAPGAAGIPVTHRQIASTVSFVTGHEKPGKEDSAVDYQALSRLIDAGGTVCFYMGVGRLGTIAQSLIKHGLSPTMPVALIQWGTLPRQKSCRGTLENICAKVEQAGITSPAIIVVGQVTAIDEPGLDFFTARPLFGKRIIITRTRQQASQLRDKLIQLGADVLEAPTIELVEPASWTAVDQAIQHITQFDWLVLTSTNAVDALAWRMEHLELDGRHLGGVKIASIGDATTQALHSRLHLRADLAPTRFVAESLAGELIAQHDIAGAKMLLLRADIARPDLPKLLTEAGAKITELVVYQTKLADALPDEVSAALRDGQIDWVTFTSASTAKNMVKLLGAECDLLGKVSLASIGPITTKALKELNLNVTTEATTSNIDGLVDALIQ